MKMNVSWSSCDYFTVFRKQIPLWHIATHLVDCDHIASGFLEILLLPKIVNKIKCNDLVLKYFCDFIMSLWFLKYFFKGYTKISLWLINVATTKLNPTNGKASCK